MRYVVFAYSQLGHDCLKFLLAEGENIAAVFTHQDSPKEHIWFDSVEKLARENGIPVFTPLSPNTPEIIEIIQGLKPDIIFSFYYRQMIAQEILDIPSLGALNMHGSLLPKYRGRCPVNWVIIHGESKTGATLHYMVKAPDAGDIVDQEAVEIKNTDTAGMLMEKINEAAQKVLKRQLASLKQGTAPRIIQDHSLASYFGGRDRKDSQIDWNQSAIQIHNLIRSLQPYPQYPPAFTLLDGEEVWMMKSKSPTLEAAPLASPGQITNSFVDEIEVACGNGDQRIRVEKIYLKNDLKSDISPKLKVGKVFQNSDF
ncbi:MAG: formyltransferase [Alphaproteobacteria bacterium]|nr:formyltransferase [Alphaproteobacteria bacterium]